MNQGFLLLSILMVSCQGSPLGVHRRGWIKIANCTTSAVQDGYACENAFDGVIDGNTGWAHKNHRPASVIFTLATPSTVSRVGLLYNRDSLQATEFKLEFLIGDAWKSPPNMEVLIAEGTAAGGKVTLSKGSNEIDIKFKKGKDVTAVRLTVFDTTASDKNSVLSEIFVQYVPDMSNCMTVGGMQRGRECIFPFVNPWSKAVHYSCTTDYGLPPWCATRTTNNGYLTENQFSGFCDKSCEVEEHSTCYGMAANTANFVYHETRGVTRRKCIFPFKQNDVWYMECWKNSRDIPECATTVDEDGNALSMQYCGPECPGSDVADQCVAARDGTGNGKRCVFPFKSGSTIYKECKGDNTCATAINSALEMLSGQSGQCGGTGSCNKDECITVGGYSVGEACLFPFKNPTTKELHWNCTTAAIQQWGATHISFASAPWCATETDAADELVPGKWGYCSKKCPQEKQNNCFVDYGTWMREMHRCIFPFIYKGIQYTQCTMVDGIPKCPIKIDNGEAKESDMKPCGPSEACKDNTRVNDKVITIGYKTVGSYTNAGSKAMSISFTFETGVEDTSESNWNVEASVSAGFSAFGAELSASITAGGGGASSATNTNHQAHNLQYNCPPKTKIELKQKLLIAGKFTARTFELFLIEHKLTAPKQKGTSRKLSSEELAEKLETRNF